MSIVVAKFGGTSLSNSDHFKKVYDIIKTDDCRKFVVVSAPGKNFSDDTKVTDLLYLCYDLSSHRINFNEILDTIYEKYKEIVKNIGISFDIKSEINKLNEDLLSGKSKEYIVSRGEYLNAKIMAKYLDYEFCDAEGLIIFKGENIVDYNSTYRNLKKLKSSNKNYVIPGFYGSDKDGVIKTFSRGGSDLTGSIVASGIGADIYENWTDVSGFFSADPRIVENPKQIDYITYKELRELSYAGASILHEESILPITDLNIPIYIKNTFRPEDKPTIILPDDSEKLKNSLKTITGIAGRKHFTIINIEKTKLNDDKGFHRKLMSVLEVNNVIIEHMPTSIDSISLIIADKYLTGNLDSIISEIKTFVNPDKIKVESNLALIAVVGRAMKNNIGVSAKLFNALAKENINIQTIVQGSSELNIIIGIDEDLFEIAIRTIYKTFLD